MKKGEFIYWKYRTKDTWNKSFLQEIIKTDQGNLLELSDSVVPSPYPLRVLQKDIDVLNKTK